MNPKEFYLHCLRNGPMKHKNIYSQMKNRYDCNPTDIRNALLAEGLIREKGSTKRKDGKINYSYELTGKKMSVNYKPKESMTWEDGTMKSRCNAFDWRNNAKGLFGKNELAAMESGRKMGINNRYDQITVYSRAAA